MYSINGVVNRKNIINGCILRPSEHNPVLVSNTGFMTGWAISKEHVIEPHLFGNEIGTAKGYQYRMNEYGFTRFKWLQENYDSQPKVAPSYRS